MGRTSRPAVRFSAVLLAPGGGWPCSCTRPGRAAGSARTIPIEAAIEALAECPSLPLGWKTGTAALPERRRRAARVPNISGQGPDPAEPVNVPVVDW